MKTHLAFATVTDTDKRAADKVIAGLDAAGKLTDRDAAVKVIRVMTREVMALQRELAELTAKTVTPDGTRVRAERKGKALSIYLKRRGQSEQEVYRLISP
jgi:hypothetical protein